MKLYDRTVAPNPRKVRVYLAEKQIEIPLVPIDTAKGEQRSPEFLAKNPAGKLPVLEFDDGTTLCESLAIMEYFEELHPTPPLIGTTARARAQVRALERIAELRVLAPTMMHVVNTAERFAGRIKQNPEFARAGLENRAAGLALIEQLLAGNEFVAGDHYTIADITLLIGVDFGIDNVGLEVAAEYPNIQRWHQAVRQRPSARA